MIRLLYIQIFHFINTYAVIIHTQPFTFDELAQAFIDKDSLLLGKLNISLLKLLTAVEKELDIEYVSHISKNWKYRALIQSVSIMLFLGGHEFHIGLMT
ncbi:DDT domain-containing protein [Tanacetum coccineum]